MGNAHAIDRAEQLMMQHASHFKACWDRGDGLNEVSEELVTAAGMAIACCQYLQRNGGFFSRRSAKKVREAIERAVLESQLSRAVALKMEPISIGILGQIEGRSVEQMFPLLFSKE